MDHQIQYLLDRAEISDTVLTYSYALDLKDWDLYRSVFAETIDLDFADLFGDPASRVTAEDFVQFSSEKLDGFVATQHLSPNHLMQINGDQAECQAYLYAWHTAPAPTGIVDYVTLRGLYKFGLHRVDDKWKIDAIHMAVWGRIGNIGVYDIAAERLAARAPGA